MLRKSLFGMLILLAGLLLVFSLAGCDSSSSPASGGETENGGSGGNDGSGDRPPWGSIPGWPPSNIMALSAINNMPQPAGVTNIYYTFGDDAQVAHLEIHFRPTNLTSTISEIHNWFLANEWYVIVSTETTANFNRAVGPHLWAAGYGPTVNRYPGFTIGASRFK